MSKRTAARNSTSSTTETNPNPETPTNESLRDGERDPRTEADSPGLESREPEIAAGGDGDGDAAPRLELADAPDGADAAPMNRTEPAAGADRTPHDARDMPNTNAPGSNAAPSGVPGVFANPGGGEAPPVKRGPGRPRKDGTAPGSARSAPAEKPAPKVREIAALPTRPAPEAKATVPVSSKIRHARMSSKVKTTAPTILGPLRAMAGPLLEAAAALGDVSLKDCRATIFTGDGWEEVDGELVPKHKRRDVDGVTAFVWPIAEIASAFGPDFMDHPAFLPAITVVSMSLALIFCARAGQPTFDSRLPKDIGEQIDAAAREARENVTAAA